MSHLSNVENKVYSLSGLLKVVDSWKQQQQKVVFTNGCFDLVHLGHISYLAEAADLGTKLIIGVNSDASVKQQGKRASRPLKDENSRAKILAALEFVDAVVIFNEETPQKLISSILPDVLVKGGDYDPTETDTQSKKFIVGSKEVHSAGGDVKVISFLPGYSTTIIENKIISSSLENGKS
jgi:rfaE bifunctional protein nucleotidyltransferase chain/domain